MQNTVLEPWTKTPELSRSSRLIVAVLVGLASGWLAGLALPRGPVTALGAVLLMAGSGAAGALAGLAARSRWALLLAPLGHVVAAELSRWGQPGPTVAPFQFDSSLGLLAVVLGRVLPGLLVVLPMLVGAAWGVGHAKRGCRGRPGLGVVISGSGLVLLAVLLAWPPSAPPVTDADGRRLPGSVAELIPVRLGGHEQWIEVRGASADLPILLYLSGGPGQSDLAFSRVLLDELTQDFLVVGWDQRGTGKSYPALDPATLTLDRAVADTVELADFLRARYGQQQVILLGESWGSLLGVLAAQRAPDRFQAFVGSGQMVSVLETDQQIYVDLLAHAERTGNTELTAALWSFGPPPYADPLAYGFVMFHYPLLEGAYVPPQAYRQRGEGSGVGPMGVLGQEYGVVEKLNVLRGLIDMFAVLYPQLQNVDLRRDARRLDVPVYLMEGSHELAARTDPAREWFELLQAPRKQRYVLPDSGHSVAFEHAEELHRILREEILGRA